MALDRSMDGKRVRLVSTTDQHTHLKSGAEGTAKFIDDMGTLAVRWDDGSTMGLIEGTDRWEVLTDA